MKRLGSLIRTRVFTGIASVSLAIMFVGTARSDVIHLDNGDRISGKIVEENGEFLIVETPHMGEVRVMVPAVSVVDRDAEASPESKWGSEPADRISPEWKTEVSIGYDTSRGNTETEQLSGAVLFNVRRPRVDEFTVKGDVYYSSADRRMDARKWYGMVRYARSFGPLKKWYGFSRVEADSDRFADIYYRLVPAAGAGYWFLSQDNIKLMSEVGFGWSFTDHYDAADTREPVLIPRIYAEWQIWEGVSVSEDLYCYPDISDTDRYRLRSETALNAVLNKRLSLRLSVLDEYNSSPRGEGTKKNDLRFISSVVVTL